MIKDYHQLIVWQKADDLAHRVFDMTEGFPREYLYDLSNQLRRAALSVPTNLAEGCATLYNKELLQFLNIARRSQSETRYLLEFALKRNLIPDNQMIESCDEIGKLLNGLIASVRRSRPLGH